MEHWHFLIQKQGDRSWLPLESPNLEILEGRYRILARSNRPNTDVEVRVTHESIQEVPPKRRIQRRSRRTNSEGLIAVIPFTHLKPGIWELQCSGDLMSDMLGKSWQYKVYLQVLSAPPDEQVEILKKEGQKQLPPPPPPPPFSVLLIPAPSPEQPTLDNIVSAEDTTEKEEDAVINQPVTPVWLKGDTAEQILHNLVELALPSSEPLLLTESVEDSLATPPPPLQLTLDEEMYVARWGEAIAINGHVHSKESHTSDIASVCGVELRIELRSPFGLEILSQIRQPLKELLLPFNITCSVDIPADCESKLILAEISLSGLLDGVGEVMLLASQCFTITADVAELLAISTASKNETKLLAPAPLALTEPEESVPSLDLEFFNLIKTAKPVQFVPSKASLKKSLPPQLHRRSQNKSATRLELPSFGNSLNKKIGAAVAKPLTEVAIAAVEAKRLGGNTFPYLKRLKALPSQNTERENNAPDAIEVEITEDSWHLDVIEAEYQTVLEYENVTETLPESENEFSLVPADGTQSQYENVTESLPESENEPSLVANEFFDQATQQLITTTTPNVSPLIEKWMQSQGYTVPESVNVQQYEYYDTYAVTPTQEQIPRQQMHFSVNPQTPTFEVKLPIHSEVETPKPDDNLEVDTPNIGEISSSVPIGENIEPVSPPEIPPEITADEVPRKRHTQKSRVNLAQEIVLDDIYNEPEVTVMIHEEKEEEEVEFAVSDLPYSQPTPTGIIEVLPIPRLYVPEGELIAGKSIRLRLQLPEIYPQVAIKLWIEDCQTRLLLDGPHLLKNLQPNSSGGLEVVREFKVPFGCLSIRIEAIALHLSTQQESHKVTIQRAVIPPDLPAINFDQLFGM